jgi:hypothetical protein
VVSNVQHDIDVPVVVLPPGTDGDRLVPVTIPVLVMVAFAAGFHGIFSFDPGVILDKINGT